MNYDQRVYEVHEYRYGDVITIWVGADGRPNRSWHVWLRWSLFDSPQSRLIAKRAKAQKLADKLNNREMYMFHDYEKSQR